MPGFPPEMTELWEVTQVPEFSLSAITRIVKDVDPDIRLGARAKEELRQSAEDYTARIAELAITLARTANRSTVMHDDIVTARERILKGLAFHQSQISDVP